MLKKWQFVKWKETWNNGDVGRKFPHEVKLLIINDKTKCNENQLLMMNPVWGATKCKVEWNTYLLAFKVKILT